MEGVRKIGELAFAYCRDLRTIEGLGCEEMGDYCFMFCTLLQSMKGWPASMTVIPSNTSQDCTGMTTVDCDLSHVTSIGANAFYNCTSLLPHSLAFSDDPAAVLAFLKRKSFLERAPLRFAIYASMVVARKQEGRGVPGSGFHSSSLSPLVKNIALLPPDMSRLVIEFAHGTRPSEGLEELLGNLAL
jgi:hypothetical protein